MSRRYLTISASVIATPKQREAPKGSIFQEETYFLSSTPLVEAIGSIGVSFMRVLKPGCTHFIKFGQKE